MGKKNQFLSLIVSPSHRDLLYSGALPRKNICWQNFRIYMSSFQVCRQCSPVQIKYVSFADTKVFCFAWMPSLTGMATCLDYMGYIGGEYVVNHNKQIIPALRLLYILLVNYRYSTYTVICCIKEIALETLKFECVRVSKKLSESDPVAWLVRMQ